MTRTGAADRVPVVVQVGPQIGAHGGMSALLETYSQLPLTRYRFVFVPTWRQDGLRGMQFFPGALVAVTRRALSRARPAVAHVHLADGGSLLREGTLLRLASRLGVPTVLSLHAGDFATFISSHPRLCRAVLARADVVVTLGPDMAAAVAPHLRPQARVAVVPNTIRLPERWTQAGEQPPVVLFAGDLNRGKGVDVLLAAWKRVREQLPEARLQLAGPVVEPDLLPLPAGAEHLGEVSRAEVQRRIASARVVVLPSRREVLPMVLLEGMAAARPVVATPVGEVPSLVGDGGSLVPVGDVEALARELLALLRDPPAASEMGVRAREVVEQRFSPSRVTVLLEDLYDDVRRTRRTRAALRAPAG